MHRVIIVVLIFSAVCQSDLIAQKKFLGIPTIEYFDSEDYHSAMSNWFINQDDRGLIYVANETGLLEYDGSNWKVKWKINERGITALYPDPSGRIYVGRMDIGYYFPSENGGLEYHSLSHLLPSDHRFVGIVNLLPYKGGYVFVGHNTLYFYDLETVRTVPTIFPHSFHVHVSNDELYMNTDGKGLSIFNGIDWDLIPQGSVLADRIITSLHPIGFGKMLAFTEKNGLYLIADDEIKPFSTELWHHFNDISSVTKLTDESFAIGTKTKGLFVMNQEGELIYHFNSSNGLETSQIRDVYQDASGNIWLAKENGIVKIQWESAFSYINEGLGLPGVGFSALASNDQIFLGTSTGLYRASEQWPIESIRQVTEVVGAINNIQNINGDILVSGVDHTYQLIGEKFEEISPEFGWFHYGYRSTKDPNVMIRGNVHGIFRMERRNGKWEVTKKYEDFEEWTKFFEFDDQGRLWTTTSSSGVFSFSFSDDYQTITTMKTYGPKDGLPNLLASKVFKMGNELFYSTSNGIYEYDPATDRFQVSAKWNERFNTKDHVYQIATDDSDNIYYSDTKKVRRLEKNIGNDYTSGTYLFDDDMWHLNGNLTVLDPKNIILARPHGFIHHNRESQERVVIPELLIRSVKVSRTNTLLFGGNFLQDGDLVKNQTQGNIHSLDFKDNSLIIGYAAIQYNQRDIEYRYQLIGFESNWSQWTSKTEKEYTNLNQGTYRFQVQTKNTGDQLSEITTYDFEILPPWYRTNTAHAGYGFGGLGLISFILLGFRKKYKAQIGRLKKVNVETEIQHKKKQLATTTMHLVDKTEFISSVKDKLKEILNNQNEKDVNRGITRIIREIDRNTADDNHWEEFEHHFDEVHHGFLKKLKNDFPSITPQEIKLSAYLRINMSTKEIANLLKVSVRGVEMARFRLRRRLNLNKEQNLVSFMMNF